MECHNLDTLLSFSAIRTEIQQWISNMKSSLVDTVSVGGSAPFLGLLPFLLTISCSCYNWTENKQLKCNYTWTENKQCSTIAIEQKINNVNTICSSLFFNVYVCVFIFNL